MSKLEYMDFTDLLDSYLDAKSQVQVNHGYNYDAMVMARLELNEAINAIYYGLRHIENGD